MKTKQIITITLVVIALFAVAVFRFGMMAGGDDGGEEASVSSAEPAAKPAPEPSKLAFVVNSDEPSEVHSTPPEVLRIDEFFVNGRLIGIPVIDYEGRPVPWNRQYPPQADLRFPDGSPWTNAQWELVQIATPSLVDGERPTPVQGVPLIFRRLPDGTKSYETHVCVLVNPRPSS